MRFEKIVWLQSNAEINLSSQKRISHHSTKYIIIQEHHHTLYQICRKVKLLSLLEIYSALEYSKKPTKMQKGDLKNTLTYTIILLSQKIFKQITDVLSNRYMMSSKECFKHRFSY